MRIGKTRLCVNNCIFCFVDQLPRNLRFTLYEKDDDWRMSLYYGNYVTFTNVSERDIRKIIRRKYSPLYVSVHAIDGKLRAEMLGCPVNTPNADILPLLKRFKENGIVVHGQVVLCPGINDGAELEKTITETRKYLRTLAVVPVGLTKFQCNGNLTCVTKEYAEKTIKKINGHQQKFLKENGTRYVWCADEFYALCGAKIPDYDSYESFSQIDNGIGMIQSLKTEFITAIEDYKEAAGDMSVKINADIATGVSAYPYITELCDILKASFKSADITVYKVVNNFFGDSVTVAGLTTGGDIATQLKGKTVSDTLLIPDTMLKSATDLFLDDMTVPQLEKELSAAGKKTTVKPVPVNGEALFNALINIL